MKVFRGTYCICLWNTAITNKTHSTTTHQWWTYLSMYLYVANKSTEPDFFEVFNVLTDINRVVVVWDWVCKFYDFSISDRTDQTLVLSSSVNPANVQNCKRKSDKTFLDLCKFSGYFFHYKVLDFPVRSKTSEWYFIWELYQIP